MRLTVIYRKNSDHARAVIEFLNTFSRKYPEKGYDELDIETREGANEASLYGVTSYPAIIVKDTEGKMLSYWQGRNLPLIDEVASYLLA